MGITRSRYRHLLWVLGALLLSSQAVGQTKGLIYKPATGAGSAILDPNGDGFTSETAAGFINDDETESEIPFVALPIIGAGEPSSDLSTGPNCGFTDLVKSTDNETVYTYSDGTYLYFRFRLGGTAENSKGYSILIDSDLKFGSSGSDADPDYTAGNPGFEVEIVLESNFGVAIYDIDNNALTSTEVGDAAVDRPYDEHCQKSIAHSEECGQDYFYDFYLAYADLSSLGITSSTPLRMLGNTVISPKPSTGGSISDIAGIDDDLGITDDLFEDLIDIFPPTSGDDLSDGDELHPRADCPGIDAPIDIGVTSVSGTSTEVDGTIIEVFKDGFSQGSTVVASGVWTLSGLTALVAGEEITATAVVPASTGTEKSVSYSDCNPAIVALTCSNAISAATSFTMSSKGLCGSAGSAVAGAEIKVYFEGVLQTAGSGSSNYAGGQVFAEADGSWIWKCSTNSNTGCNGGAGCAGWSTTGSYEITQTESGKCESDPLEYCAGGAATSTVPTFSGSLTTATTTLSGSATTGASVTWYLDGVEQATTTASAGSWSFTPVSLAADQTVRVVSIEPGLCSAEASTTVGGVSLTPAITGTYCTGSTIASVSGYSSEVGGTVTLYTKGSAGVTTGDTQSGTTTVSASGDWTITSLNLSPGTFMAATVTNTGELESGLSNEAEIFSQTMDGSLAITTSSANEGDASISGTGTAGNTIQLHLDGIIEDGFTTTVDGSGNWTISGLDAASAGYNVLFAGGVVGVSSQSGSLCASDVVSGFTVDCLLPVSQTVTATTSTSVCSDKTITFNLASTENLVVYQLVDQSLNPLGTAALGDGTAMDLVASGLSSSVTSIAVKALKMGVTCETTFGNTAVLVEGFSISHVSSNPTDCASPNGSITISGVSSGQAYNVDYNVDGVAASESLTANGSGEISLLNLGPGEYTDITVSGLVITLSCTGNVIAGPVVLTNASSPTLSLGAGSDPTTCGGTDGSIALTSSIAAVTSYTLNYMKDGATLSTSLASDASGNISWSGLGVGTYSNINIVNTSDGCKSNNVGPSVLSDPTLTIALAGSSNPASCGGNGSFNLTFTGLADGSYTVNHDGGSFAGVTVTSGSATVTTPAGTYTNINVVDPVTSCTLENGLSVTISDPATHTIAATRTNPTTCGGNGSINLTFTNVTDGTYTIDYKDGVGASQSFSGVSVTSNAATISTTAGAYNDLSLTLSGCVSTGFPDITISDPTPPTISLNSSSNPSTCSGTDGSITLDFTGVADGTYTLNYVDGALAAQTFTGVSVSSGSATISGLGAGVYNDITITVSGCTSTDNIDVTLSDPTTPTITLNGSLNPSTCSGTDGSITLDFTGVADGTYTLNYVDGALAAQTFTGVSVSSGSATISGLGAGVYNDITITIAGCTSTDNIDVTLSDPTTPTITLNSSSNPSTCSGTDGSITLDFTGVADGTYTLNYVDGALAAQTFTGVSVSSGSATISGLGAGVYNDITITIAGCTSTDNIDVTLSDPTTPTITLNSSSNPSTCSGTDGSITLDFTGVADGSYTLNYVDGALAAQTFTGVSVSSGSATISGLGAGVYNDITITIAGCTSTDNIDVTLSDPTTPTISLNSSSNPSTCSGTDGSITLDFTGVADGTYTLNYVDGALAAQTFTGVSVSSGSATISGLGAGVYNDITITIAGCTSTDNIDVTLSDPTTPTITLNSSSNPSTCSGTDGSITLDFTGVADGTYTLNYVDGALAAQTFTGVSVSSGSATISGLGAGVYNDITITVSGCTSTDNIDVTLSDPTTPTITLNSSSNPSTCSGTDGSITLDFTGVADGTYTLNYVDGALAAQTFTGVSVSSGSATISGLGAGVYNDITITIAGCTSTDNIDVTLSDPTTPTITLNSSSNPSTCSGTDGSITLDFTGVADGTYTLNYVDGALAAQTFTGVSVSSGSATISGLGAGVYNDITITIAGCTSTDNIDVTLSDPTTPTITLNSSSNPSTCSGTDGSITLDFTGVADGSYTLNYVDGALAAQTFTGVSVSSGSATISGLGAGVYNDITITIAGCTSTDNIDVTLSDPTTPTISLNSSSNPSTCSGTDGSITLDFTGVADGTYTLNYVDGALAAQTFTGVSVSSGSATISGLGAGVYNDITITVSGCTSTDNIDVTLSDPTTPTISLNSSSNPSTCSGTDGSITLDFTGVADGTYTLNYVDGALAAQTFTGVSVSSGSATISGLGAGVYNDITITVSGCTSTDNIDVTLSDPTTPTISLNSSSNPSTCSGTDGSITLGFTGVADGTYTLNYVDGALAAQTFTGVSVSSGSATISGLGAGVYNDITITIAGCTSTDNIDVTLSDPTTPTITLNSSSNPSTCSGTDGSITLDFTGVADGTYTLNYVDGALAAQTFTGVSVSSGSATISGLGAGVYNDITITIAGCTSTDNIDVTLSDPTTPTITLNSSSNPSTCSGTDGSITLDFTGVADGTYTLNYVDGALAAQTFTGVSVSSGSATISGLGAGVYNDITITVSGCTSTDNIDVTLTNPGAPTISVNSSSNPSTCSGTDGSITLDFTGVADGTYTLNYVDGALAAQTFTGVSVSSGSATISGLGAGVYNDITITVSGCTSTDNIDVTLSDPTTPTITLNSSLNPSTCSGTDGSITLDFTGVADGTYTLNYVDGALAAQTFTGVSVSSGSATISGLGAGVYNDITITIAGCTSTDNIDVTLNNPGAPTISLNSSSNPSTCSGTDGSITLDFTGVADGTYTLNYVDGALAAQTFTGVSVSSGSATISGLGAGVYNDITITISGCTSTDNIDVTLSDPTTPTITLNSSSNPSTCSGTDGSITLDFTGVADGTYTLNYVDGALAAQTFTGVSVSSGSATISGLGAGVYNDITITLSGCTSTDNIDVTLSDPTTPTITLNSSSNPSTCSGTDGSITLDFTGVADGTYTLNYVDGALAAQTFTGVSVSSGSATISGLGAGVYNDITITIAGCTSTDNIDVTLSDPTTPTITLNSSSNPSTCSGTDGSITLDFTGVADGTYTLNYVDGALAAQTFTGVSVSSGSATISGLGAGVYNDITITLSGCTSTDNIDVTLSDPTTPTISLNSSSNPSTCSGTDGSITLDFTGVADGTYTLNYVDGALAAQTFTGVSVSSGSATISGLGAGVYNDITITVSGCTSTDNIDVTLSDPTTPTISLNSSSNPSTCSGTDGSITLDFTGVADGTYTLNYVDGALAAQTFTGVSVSSGSATISGLGAGVYNDITITVSGCTSTDNIDVTLSDPTTPTISLNSSSNPSTCSGTDGSITLGFTGVADGTYTLNYVDGALAAQTFTGVSVSSGSATISGLGAGVYNDITITVSGCTSTDNIDVTLSDPTTPTISPNSSSNPSTCSGTDGSITLDFTGVADGTYTLNYVDGALAAQTFTGVSVSSGSATISSLGADVYNDITITLSGCTSTDNIDVTLSDPTTPTISLNSSSNPSTCSGTDGSITLDFTGVADGTYTLNYVDGALAAQTFTGVSVSSGSATISGLGAGVYNDITITVSGCTSTDNIDVTLSDPTTPTISLNSSSNPSTCSGTDGSITLDFTGVADGTYTLNYVDGALAAQTFTGVSVSSGSATISGLGAGVHNDITITISGCTSTDNIDVTLSDPTTPTITLNSSSNPSTCSGTDGSITLGFTGVADGTYTLNYVDGALAAQTFTGVSVSSGSATISGLGAGVYNDITITIAGCTSTDNIDVTLSDPTTPTISLNSSSNPSTCGGTDGSITLDFTGVADGTYTLNYVDGALAAQTFTGVSVSSGSATISSRGAGVYNDITITVSGCTSTDNIDVTLTNPGAPTISVNSSSNPSTCSGTDGSITLDFTGVADGTYTLNYVDGALAAQTFTGVSVSSGSATISGLGAGVYNDITITISGCTSTDNIDVTLSDPTTPTITLNSSSNPSTCSGTDGSITLDFTGVADGTYTLNYVDGALAALTFTGVSVSSGSATISGLGAGVYNDITITIAGCTSTDNIDVTLSDPTTPTISLNSSSNPSTCGGTDGSITLDFTGVADGTYTLNYVDGALAAQTFTGVSVSSGSATISGLGAGVYNDITITISGCTSTDNIDVTLSDPTTPTITLNSSSNPSTCSGTDGSITLDFTGVADGTYTLNYVDGALAAQTFTGVSVSSGSATISGLGAGVYNDITITISGCTSTDNIDVTLSDPTTPTISLNSSSNPSTCSGTDGSITLDFTGVADGTYTLNYVDGALAAQTFTGVSVSSGSATISGLGAGVYNDITITIAGCTSTDNIDVTLSDPTTPTISLNSSSNPSTCGGTDGSITLDFTGVADGTYTLNYVDGALAAQTFTGVSVSSGSATISSLGAGVYNDITITVSGCTSTDNMDVTLTNPGAPTISVNSSSNPSTCSGTEGSITLDFTGVADGTYTLNYVDGALAAQTFTGVSVSSGSATISGLGAGVYNDITITLSGCTSTDNIDVTLSDPTTPTISLNSSSNPSTCSGTDGSITLDFTGVADGTYTLNYVDGALAAQTFTGVSVSSGSATISGLGAGVYNDITITIAGCTSTDNIDVTLNNPGAPTISLNSSSNPSTCSGTDGSITLDFTGVADGTYTLNYVDGALAAQTFTGVSVSSGSATISGLGAGVYNDITITISGCTSTDNIDVTLNNPGAPTAPTVATLLTNSATPTIMGTADAGNTVTVVVGGATYSTTADGSGDWSIDTSVDTPTSGSFAPDVNGDNEVVATASNGSCNTSDTSSNELTIDTTAPATPTITSQTTNDTTPTLTGTAEAGTTVTVVIDGVTFTTTADGSGDWSIDTGSDTPTAGGPFMGLSEGDYDIAITSTDGSGNSTSDGSTNELTIDTTAPATPTITSQTTNDTTPTLTGTAEAGNTVTVVIDGVTFTTTADGSGDWSIDTGTDTPTAGGPFTGMLEGDYEIAVTSTDGAGNNTSDGSANELTIDTTAPATPTITSQTTNDTTPTLTGTAEAGTTVTVVIDGVTFTTTADGSGDWSIDTGSDTPTAGGPFTGLSEGDYEIAVTSTDGAGNSTSDGSSNELTIDTTAPATPTITSQTTNDTTPTLTGTAEAGTTVTVVIDGVTFTTTADGSGDWGVDTGTDTPTAGGPFTGLSEGDYEIAVTSTDGAGNSTSDGSSNELTIDTTAPATPTIASQTTNDTTPTLTGTAEAGTTVTVVIDGVTFTTTADGSGDWSIDTGSDTPTAGGPFMGLSEGDYDIAITSTDGSGNSTSDGSTNELTIDTTAPATPTITSQTTNDTTPTLTGTAEAGNTVTVVIDGVTFTTTADGSGDWSIDTGTDTPTAGGPFTGLSEGDYDIAITSTDGAGNAANDASSSELVITTGGPSVPTINSQVTNDTTPILTGTADAGTTITVVVDGVTFTTTADEEGNWSLDTETETPTTGGPFTGLADGSQEVSVTSTDGSGDSASDTSSGELVIDTIGPSTPTVNTQLSNDPTPVVTGSAEAGTTVTVVIDGVTFTTSADSDGNWSVDTETLSPSSGGPFTGLADGVFDVQVTSLDDAGNSSSDGSTNEVTIDTTAPAAPTITSGTTNDRTPTLTGTAEPGSTLTIVIDGVTFTTTADSDGNWSIDTQVDSPTSGGPFTGLAEGDYEIIVTSTDSAGNSVSGDSQLTIVIDTPIVDTDGDGILDSDEDTNGDGDLANDDCDGDGVANYLDTDYCDTDGDGLLDDIEDANENGDFYDDDCDNDGTANFLDPDLCDSDNDGIPDVEEDDNGDGDLKNDDCDDDGVPDYLDRDLCVAMVEPHPGFTPNGDGINDFFYIDDIEDFPNNTVQIFNRWGNKVFEIAGYNNQDRVWTSESNFGIVYGDKRVPDGTYYYLIDLGDGSAPLSGFVVISK